MSAETPEPWDVWQSKGLSGYLILIKFTTSPSTTSYITNNGNVGLFETDFILKNFNYIGNLEGNMVQFLQHLKEEMK